MSPQIPLPPYPTNSLLKLIPAMETVVNRPGEWMPTFTGRRFYPDDPRPEEVSLEDISQGLSRQPRFNGQTRWVSRVGSHSTLISLLVPLSEALPGLFHDSSEAYIGDLTRPFKMHLRKKNIDEFDRLEALILKAIFDHFKIAPAYDRQVPDAIPWSPDLTPDNQSQSLVGKIVKCADTAAVLMESVRLYGHHEVKSWEVGPFIPWAETWFFSFQEAAQQQNHVLLQRGYGIPSDIFRRLLRSEALSEEESKLIFELRYKDIRYMQNVYQGSSE